MRDAAVGSRGGRGRLLGRGACFVKSLMQPHSRVSQAVDENEESRGQHGVCLLMAIVFFFSIAPYTLPAWGR